MASLKQQQYRRLMKEQKASSSKKKIDHPLAKYNALGQINCIVCNIQVKSELLWSTHLQSRKHKDSVVLLKSQKTQPVSTSTASGAHPQPATVRATKPAEPEFLKPSAPLVKRKAPPNHSSEEENGVPLSKKPKTEEKSSKKKKTNRTKADSSAAGDLPSDFFDSGVSKRFVGHGEEDSGGSDDEVMSSTPSSSTSQPSQPQAAGGKETVQNIKGNSTKKSSQGPTDSLPEGFFDDPKLDAKARKVEYKDPITEEWEKFQKSIQKEDDVSEALLLEGDEESKEEREHVEVKEQVFWFDKAEELRLKQEQIQEKRQEGTSSENKQMDTENNSDSNSTSDDSDFDEFLDWRAKMT